ncbi:Alphaamylase [Chamberlinius hualienensis]
MGVRVEAGAANKNNNMAAGRSVIVEMFQWKWKDLALECERFLGPYGFGAIQTSPPSENAVVNDPARPWWEIYQPVSYKLETRDGTEAEFQDMVNRCNAAGVRVYIDAVMNHMTGGGGSGTGTGGSSWDSNSLNFPAVPYTSSNFHSCSGDCGTSDCQIQDYNNANQVRNCQLTGLVDLNQGNSQTQSEIVGYMNKLVGYGVAGFRMDAAKHMWPGDLDSIYNSLNNLPTNYFPAGSKPYVYQEVIDYGGTEAVHASDYVGLGDVTEFKYGYNLAYVFRRENPMKYLSNWGEGWGMMSSSDAIAFIDNHDSQRGGGGAGFDVLTFWDDRMYKMANAFMLAHPYGQVRVMSSFYWPRDIEGGRDVNDWYGPPHDGSFNIASPVINPDLSCDYYSWVCEHRWRQIYNMVGFRNAVDGTDIANWWSGSDYSIAFSRGNKGFLAINNESFDMNANLQTGLPAGTYCDVISGNVQSGSCTGTSVSVDGSGNAQIFISGSATDPIIAIHVQAKL